MREAKRGGEMRWGPRLKRGGEYGRGGELGEAHVLDLTSTGHDLRSRDLGGGREGRLEGGEMGGGY